MKIVLFFLIFIFFIFTNLLAGTINPNTQDSKYIEYGKKFESVVPIQVYLENRPDDADPNFGSAVIIKPKWAITAAHVVKQQKKCFILKNQKKYLIDKVISHKDFNEDNVGVADIALVRSSESFDIKEYPDLYEDNDELGKTASISGYGFTTTLKNRITKLTFDNNRRAGTNIVENIYIDILICSSNNNGNTPLEFIICGGDSGGGLFIDNKLAGINSCVLATDGYPDSSYGDETGHTRISKFNKWILEKIETNE